MEDNLPVDQKRMFRFLHSSLAIISLIWIALCLLAYFHAPSAQVFDCRWYLSALLIQAIFGHIFVFSSRTTFLFIAAFISTQYAVVYSMLTLVIYTMDTILLAVSTKPTMLNYMPYMKLTAVLIVLAGFGLALSLVHLHRLVQFGRLLGITPNMSTLPNIRTYRALTVCQIIFALLSMYVAASLVPMKFWYVRVHLVQEFSCSLLAITLAFLQFVLFRQPNGNGPFLLKGIIFANACQLVQELNMALSAFYTLFYIDRIYDVVKDRQEELSLLDPHIEVALTRARRAKTMLALNLALHIGRMLANGYLLFSLANQLFSGPLSMRVKFKVDSELVNADENWEKLKRKQRKWLYSIGCCVLAIGIGHLLLNFGYIWASMIFESLSVSTGLSFVFAMALVISIGFYALKMLRFFLILSAYISLNLLITASLLLFSFFQDFFFLATALDNEDENDLLKLNSSMLENGTAEGGGSDEEEDDSSMRILLYFSDFGLSLGTFLIAGFTIRYAIRTLVKTKLLQTQSANVQRTIRILRALALVGIVSSAIEIFMLAELRLGTRSKITAHSSINSSFYDWLLSSSQFLFLFYVTRYERFQALLPVQLLQLASVSVTTLDLIGQQTETVQVYVNNVLQFYRVTEALLGRSTGAGAAADSAGTNTIFIAQPFTIPLHLFVDILTLHFIQIIQWFLTISALAIALYAFDNMVEDESDQVNDFHELRSNGTNAAPLEFSSMAPPAAENGQQQNGTNPPSSLESAHPKMPANGKPAHLNNNKNSSSTMAFDNKVFDDEAKRELEKVEKK